MIEHSPSGGSIEGTSSTTPGTSSMGTESPTQLLAAV
jgi:hypothetical protein